MTPHHGAAFVSLIGLGLGPAEVASAEQALERSGIPLVAVRATPTALIFRVATDDADRTVQALHGAFIAKG